MSRSGEKVYLAVDMGASGGRVVAGCLGGGKLRLEEIHRFGNGPVVLAGNMHWDLPRQWTDIQDGLRAARTQFGDSITSLGVDTWGVDYGLLDRNDELLGNPFNYRDARTNGMMEAAFSAVGRDAIFAATGLQFMQLNTLYQLMAMRKTNSPILDVAETLLMMPDLFHWLLTGEKANEFTDATTTQFYNPATGSWATGLLKQLDIPTTMLKDIILPGTEIGKLRAEVARDTGLTDVNVVVPGTHDTASAVMAVPTSVSPSAQPTWCYISSGTWSLMGVEVPEPVINDKCRTLNFTNEGGVGNTIRLLRNICGLWLVQECRRVWSMAGKTYEWDQLVDMARATTPLVSHIDPDDSRFLAPENMPAAIAEYCQATGQQAPQSEGEVIRCALEGVALSYRRVLGWLEELTGGRLDTIHIVGGGTQNRLLCQMAADACQRRVITGPIEATAIGNIMMQAVAAGDVGSIAEARQVIRNSFPVEEFEPGEAGPWEEAFARFSQL